MSTDEIVGAIIDRFEGHTYTNDPADAGGATRYGITLRALTRYRRKKSGDASLVVTAEDVRDLTRGEAVDVLVTAYAVEPGLVFILDERLRFVVLDYAVHAGPSAAITALQTCVGVKVDGLFGPVSQNAVNRHANPVQLGVALLARRSEAMQRLIAARPAMLKYQGGFFNRVIANMRQLAAALALVLLLPSVASADDWLTHILIGGVAVTSFADASSTSHCFGAGTCREANPLFRPFVDRSVVGSMALKGAATYAMTAWLWRMHRDHPTRARLVALGFVVMQGAVVAHNVRTLRGRSE